MTPRSLFNIILKVIGIFFIRNILISASNIIPAVAEVNKEEFRDFGILNLVILLLEFLRSLNYNNKVYYQLLDVKTNKTDHLLIHF